LQANGLKSNKSTHFFRTKFGHDQMFHQRDSDF